MHSTAIAQRTINQREYGITFIRFKVFIANPDAASDVDLLERTQMLSPILHQMWDNLDVSNVFIVVFNVVKSDEFCEKVPRRTTVSIMVVGFPSCGTAIGKSTRKSRFPSAVGADTRILVDYVDGEVAAS